ncbi:MAG: type II toxin-antitoxin system VapC family toxin [Petrimonas sp.]|nr:type II toxin-antitoxin system VapC family toxin [Petrimonas sp.]
MEQRYLIDTCTIVKYLAELLPAEAISFLDTLVDNDCRISFITKIELLVWNPPISEDIKVREEFIAGSKIHFVDDEIINKAIEIRKSTNIKLPDAVIAATAIHNDYVLLSTNDNDFKKVIPLGLKYLNPETDL